MTEQVFRERMAMMQAYYGHDLPTGKNGKSNVYSMYWQMLKHLSDEQFKLAVTNLLKDWHSTSRVPFPLVADFLSHCGESSDIRAQRAVSMVREASSRVGSYRSIDFQDRALHAIIERFGGWIVISHWTQKEWNINEKRFVEAYKAAVSFNETGPKYLPGKTEKENAFSGHDHFIKPPTMVCYKKGQMSFIEAESRPQLKAPKDQADPKEVKKLMLETASKLRSIE